MNTALLDVQPGARFSLWGAKFEVAHAAGGSVRYASVTGGKIHVMPLREFANLPAQLEGLATVANGDHVALSEKESPQRKVAIAKVRFCESALSNLIHPFSRTSMAVWVEEHGPRLGFPKLPVSTAHRWLRNFERGGRSISVFFKHEERGNSTLRFSVEIESIIAEAIEQFLQKENFSGLDAHAFLVGTMAERRLLDITDRAPTVPTLRTIQRRIAKLDPVQVVLAKRGRLAADRVGRAAGCKLVVDRPLQRVQIDSHRIDLIIVDSETGEVIGRPWIVVAICQRTRCVVGYCLSLYAPSAMTTLVCLKDMLTRPSRGLPGGVPIELVPDNGSEFNNGSLAHLCYELSINVLPAEVRDPDGKAHIESFFRTLTKSLIQKMAGTTFSSPEERGDYDSIATASHCLVRTHEYVDEWLNGVYHQSKHTQSGRVPICQWRDELADTAPLSLTAEDADVLARSPVLRSINQGRIQYDYLTYYSHGLATIEATWDGKVTVLIDDLDLSRVFVKHPTQPRTLIQADCTEPEYSQGLTRSEHLAARAVRKEMGAADLRAVGVYAAQLSRFQLLLKIQTDCAFAQRAIKKYRKLAQSSTKTLSSNKPETESAATAEIPLDHPAAPRHQHLDSKPSVDNDAAVSPPKVTGGAKPMVIFESFDY